MVRFGITEDLIHQPLLYALQHSLIDHPFELISQSPAQNTADLCRGKLDAALIGPVDYARNSSELLLVPDVIVSSHGAARHGLLYFRENQQHISRVVCRDLDSQYRVLADMVMKEFFEIEIEWISLPGGFSLEKALGEFPACLAEGPEALRAFPLADNFFDLLEAWRDNAELDYVHYLLAVPEAGEWEARMVEPLRLSRELGLRNIKKIAQDFAGPAKTGWDAYYDLLNKVYHYAPDDALWTHLRDYFQYLFYYGEIEFLPEMRFV